MTEVKIKLINGDEIIYKTKAFYLDVDMLNNKNDFVKLQGCCIRKNDISYILESEIKE